MERELTVQERAAAVGLSMARLARESRVHYHRIHLGYELDDDEETAVKSVLDRYQFRQRTRNAAAV